jgi:hypothetical protein
LPPSAVTLLPGSLSPTGNHFIALTNGQLVAPIDVFTTATDEPDYGLDIGLWEDSGTRFGRAFQFGKQPFGNPKLEFSSQAPFHMGFFHEPSVIYWAASYLSRTLPEYRVHLFSTLSQFAFRTGHPYWGYRFAGWGAHYIQDLTQPYHSTVLPGENPVKMLFYGLLDKIGIHGPKNRLLQRASDEHLAIEKQVYCEVLRAFTDTKKPTKIAEALIQKKPGSGIEITTKYVRHVLTKESNEFSDAASFAVHRLLPKKPFIPAAYAGARADECSQPASTKDEALFHQLMNNFGEHTRAFLRSLK